MKGKGKKEELPEQEENDFDDISNDNLDTDQSEGERSGDEVPMQEDILQENSSDTLDEPNIDDHQFEHIPLSDQEEVDRLGDILDNDPQEAFAEKQI
ncbi:MAG: hypothetical protein U9R75_12760 [Candidatus Thermoplasmatota archaeon]|nr:hypothetical protein [Candidatus Thermoplasmatota archaeon]